LVLVQSEGEPGEGGPDGYEVFQAWKAAADVLDLPVVAPERTGLSVQLIDHDEARHVALELHPAGACWLREDLTGETDGGHLVWPGQGQEIDDDHGQVAVGFWRCVLCHWGLVAMGIPTKPLAERRWFELGDAYNDPCAAAGCAWPTAEQVDGPPMPDGQLRHLLDRVTETYNQRVGRTGDPGAVDGRTNDHRAGERTDGPDVADGAVGDLRRRLAAARVEARTLRPVIERLTAVYAEAETIAINGFSDAKSDDLAFDRFLTDVGAVALGDTLRDLAMAMTTPAGTWIPL
jgi:hypothetical protein